MNNKINKNVVPEGFTVPMAMVDMIPVIFFGLAFIKASILIGSIPALIGALICLVSGVIKVLWKVWVSVCKKNVWWMFMQMRIMMPIGFVIIIIGSVIAGSRCMTVIDTVVKFPNLIFLVLGIVGMGCMMAFTFILDSTDSKSNWIEQCINGFSQLCFFIALMI